MAQLSYSLYLVHEAVMLWLFPKTAALWGPSMGAYPTIALAALVAVVLSVIFATLLYLFVEQPCMRARSRLGFKRATEPTLTQVPATPGA